MIFDNDPVEDIVSSLPSCVCGVKDCYKKIINFNWYKEEKLRHQHLQTRISTN